MQLTLRMCFRHWLARTAPSREKIPRQYFPEKSPQKFFDQKEKITITIKKNEDFLISIGEIKLVCQIGLYFMRQAVTFSNLSIDSKAPVLPHCQPAKPGQIFNVVI